MENSETRRYKLITIALIVAILAIFIFAILPNYLPSTPEKNLEKIDFSNSAWIEKYIDESIGLFGKDFYINTAYSYNPRSNKMVVTYASQNTVDEARAYYLTLPGAELTGRNDETSLNISAEIDGQTIRVYNYYSSISRVFEIEIILDEVLAEQITSQLRSEFPEHQIAEIDQLAPLLSNDIFGGYVRYNYDRFSGFSHPDLPIFSRAYYYQGSEDEFVSLISALNQAYPDHTFDETQNTNHYRINGKIISLSYLITDASEKIVTISIQQEPDQE